MKPHISAFLRRSRLSRVTYAAGIVGLVMSGCGEQAPSFVEEAQLVNEVQTDDATAGVDGQGTGSDGDSIAKSGGKWTGSGSPGSYGSYKPGDDVNTSGGYHGLGAGLESYAGLPFISDAMNLQVNSKVDILWVVDSSGSMSDEQTALGNNFTSFISNLSQTNSEFQVGVTSTDVCDNTDPRNVPVNRRYCPELTGASSGHYQGSLVGTAGQRVLKPNTSNLQSKFVNYAKVGTSGSGFEHGLTAAKMAVQKSLAGQNEGLVRSDAFLSVIVVSDEEDDGIKLDRADNGMNYIAAGLTSYRYTDEDFISDMLSMKGSGKFSVSAITGTKLANGQLCSSTSSQPVEEGSQYIKAANKSGGTVQSICDTNWNASLARIGLDIAAQSSQIVLSHIPYASSIRVYVNGTETTRWSYNGGNNSIRFDSGHVPPNGANVSVQYYTAP